MQVLWFNRDRAYLQGKGHGQGVRPEGELQVTNEEREAAIAEGRHRERLSWAQNRLTRWLNYGKISFQADEGQVRAFNDLFEALLEQCHGSKSQAVDRMLAAMGNEVSDGLGQ